MEEALIRYHASWIKGKVNLLACFIALSGTLNIFAAMMY